MAGKLQITFVEAALLQLLSARLPISYGQRVDVQTMGSGDFDDDGQLVLVSPAVRLHFTSGSYATARDIQRVAMNAELEFSLFCFHEDLRGQAKERENALALVATAQDELAGARLKLKDGSYTEPILLTGVQQALDVAGPVDQCYAVSFRVTGLVQFSGVNSNFGVKA